MAFSEQDIAKMIVDGANDFYELVAPTVPESVEVTVGEGGIPVPKPVGSTKLTLDQQQLQAFAAGAATAIRKVVSQS